MRSLKPLFKANAMQAARRVSCVFMAFVLLIQPVSSAAAAEDTGVDPDADELAVQDLPEITRQPDVRERDGTGEKRRDLLRDEARNPAADAGHQESHLRVLRGEFDELVHIGLDGFHPALHGRDGVAPAL